MQCLRLLWLPAVLCAQTAPLFERDIVPLLSAHCWKCHGMEARKAGLDLRTPPLILRGGQQGPAIEKGSAGRSPLYRKIAAGEMPPGKELKLRPEQVEVVRRWIDAGAPAARSYDALTRAEAPEVSEKDRQHWAFQPLRAPAPPRVRQSRRLRTPIDAFLLARLEPKKLGFAPAADRRTLARRAWFDLLGLPPSPEEVAAFESDRAPGAWERLLDRLLASPHFGERWGRHWLDAAGYADVHGIDTNVSVLRAGEGKWRYRDYVVRSFNQDKPYDRFLTEQLAGDELVDWRQAQSFSPAILDALEATGFLRTAADDTDNNELNIALIRYRVLHLTIQNFSSNVLGLTVTCAQCHSHKYDPIPQLDYYRLMAVFLPAYNPQSWPQTKDRYLADVAPVERAAIDRHNADLDQKIKPFEEQLAAIRRPYEDRLLDKKLGALPESLRADLKAALKTPEARRTEIERYLVRKLQNAVKVAPEEAKAALSAEDRAKYALVEERIAPLEKQRRSYGRLQALYDVGPPPSAYLLRRGNHETPVTEVEPGFLSVLTEPGKPVTIPACGSPTSGRRLALARWLTAPGTPASALVARVFVNRVWQQLFGEGIVSPPDNFGRTDTPPSHPELLDWLAADFIRSGWRVKPLVRALMLSSAYTQASHRSDAAPAAAVDPGNRLLWRMRLRRLESEAIRDSILSAAGQLDRSLGGAPVKMDYQPDGMVRVAKDANPRRRSLYLYSRRSFNLTMLNAFDQPVMDTNCTRRNSSAVVLQSLAMLNDGFVLEQAGHFAARVAAEAGLAAGARIDRAFRIAFGRRPSGKEVAWSEDLLEKLERRYRGQDRGEQSLLAGLPLAGLCHALLNTNEFLYVE